MKGWPAEMLAAILCGLGCSIAILVMVSSSTFTDYPLGSIPFATSIVLVISQPYARPAQPRALIGGHLLSACVGVLVLAITGPGAVAASLAVGLAVLMMVLTDTLHPPAGINPLLVVTGNLPWWYVIVPVSVGALALAAFAFLWHRHVMQKNWPDRWY
jgi:CBS-domain-containing membrane protein